MIEGLADFSASSLNYLAGWLSAIAPQKTRGYAFGVHKALDKAGAVLGPLVAYALLSWLGETPEGYRMLFWVAFVPAVLAVVVLGFIEDKPGISREHESVGENWKLLSPGFKRFLLPAGIFALGSINLALVFASSQWEIIAVFACYGLFYAVEDSQTKALIADLEHDRRATAMGVYNFVTGLLYLPASLIAGALWTVAPEMAFGLAALLSLVAMGVFAGLRPGQCHSAVARI